MDTLDSFEPGIPPTRPDPGDRYLIGRIHNLIRKRGRITFAEFMDTALYDPKRGYYTSGRERVGTIGDYLTSPAMHPVFGAMIARWITGGWEALGSPKTFHIVEMGTGKGLLCACILSYLRDFVPDLYSGATYLVVEKKELRHPEQLAPLSRPLGREFPGKLHVVGSLTELPDAGITGCFVSNELVDAFPVHLVTVSGGELKEIYVGLDDGDFVEEIGDPSTPEIPAHLERLDIRLGEGYRTEINLRALDWIREVANKLATGSVLTIDYGYTAQEYYSPDRRRGTLLCYCRHSYSEDPYIRVGKQDITSHVDFTSLMHAGRGAGLKTAFYTTQREFLQEQGIENWLGQMADSDVSPQQKRSERRAVAALLDPRGMGKFKVLGQEKRSPSTVVFDRGFSRHLQPI